MSEMREDRREGAALCVWLDAMGQRLSRAFMNAYFKQDPSRANLCCSPEWGCWLRANYTLQIWPLVTTVLIWHSLDSGLGACLWAKAPDSHASVSPRHRRKMSVCMMHAGRLLFTDAIINAFILTGCIRSKHLLYSAISALVSFSFFLVVFFSRREFVSGCRRWCLHGGKGSWMEQETQWCLQNVQSQSLAAI